jgi:hypothetical protein
MRLTALFPCSVLVVSYPGEQPIPPKQAEAFDSGFCFRAFFNQCLFYSNGANFIEHISFRTTPDRKVCLA